MKLTPCAQRTSALDEKILEITSLNASFRAIPESIRDTVKILLERVNSFYSNKIEGNPTKPKELIELDSGKNKKGINEIRRHISVQNLLKDYNYSPTDISSEQFIKFLHESFYKDTPIEERTVISEITKQTFYVEAGEYRTTDVEVGNHFPPQPDELNGYMSEFSKIYKLSNQEGLDKFYKAAASHHRLTWIHPFLDGNGRVTRLFTDCYMKAIGLDSYGLWSMSRGFARDTDKYYAHLAIADQRRQGNYDGRGILSDRGLATFTEYFFDIAIDQMKFFLGLLDPQGLKTRISLYFDICIGGGMIDLDGNTLPKLSKESKRIYEILLYEGPKMRKDIEEKLQISEKTLRNILNEMQEYGLVFLQHKQPIKPRLAPSSIQIFFPHLFI